MPHGEPCRAVANAMALAKYAWRCKRARVDVNDGEPSRSRTNPEEAQVEIPSTSDLQINCDIVELWEKQSESPVSAAK